MLDPLKRCAKCGDAKPRKAFHRAKRYADGLYVYCKDCVRSYQQEYTTRPEVQKARQEYRQKPEVRARDQASYQTDEYKTKKKEYQRQRRTQFQIQAQIREYRQMPEVKAASRERAYKQYHEPSTQERIQSYRQRPEVQAHRKEHSKEYRQRPEVKEMTPVHAAHHRARINGLPGTFTAAQFRHLLQLVKSRCVCCGAETRLDRDHVIPISVGGCNCIKNIQPICHACNVRKGKKASDFRPQAVHEWLASLPAGDCPRHD